MENNTLEAMTKLRCYEKTKKIREKSKQYYEDSKEGLKKASPDWYRELSERVKQKRVLKKSQLEYLWIISKRIMKRIQVKLIWKYVWRRETKNQRLNEKYLKIIQEKSIKLSNLFVILYDKLYLVVGIRWAKNF